MAASRFRLTLAAGIVLAGCTGSPATPSLAPVATPASTPTAAASPTPTVAPTATVASTTPPTSAGPSPSAAPTFSSVPSAPGATLDPSQSDAGVVAEVTVTGDTRANRDGTYTIAGHSADGSSCGYSFDGADYDSIAWYAAAPSGQISRFSVTVPATDVPAADGNKAAISGRVSFDFVAESAIGATYTGDASKADNSQASIDITRVADSLRFDFTGTTWDGVAFAGAMDCAEAGLGG